ncbi:MAG: Antitoxin Phd YefM, type toxin-antitoxin system [Caulobacteraceae bacterium]|nr:Antitoxin Phd YefM, type toxin-antitoxin system [Caulobacteraceae bacterium]
MRYSITEARKNFSKLIDLALAGEEVMITRRGVVVVTLNPVRADQTQDFMPGTDQANI